MKKWLMECSSIKTDPTRRALSVRLCIILFGRGPEAPSSEGGRSRRQEPTTRPGAQQAKTGWGWSINVSRMRSRGCGGLGHSSGCRQGGRVQSERREETSA
jgi:hypothetical protein